MFRTLSAALLVLTLALPAQAETISGRVARVYDGDTFTIDGHPTRVRLWGIDAPERKQTCQDARSRPYPCGERARQALESAALGRRVVCAVQDHDRHRRPVARCSVQGADLGGFMVEAGYATDYRAFSGGAYARAERAARRERRGLWSGRFEPPSSWRARHR